MATDNNTHFNASLANAETPLIHNSWYVVAQSQEISREPMSRQILGTSIVLYRTEAGEAVALQNRCCHRSFPLAEGFLQGDDIVCNYHGLRYNCKGQCVAIPMQDTVSKKIKIKSYALIEKNGFIWIWMGNPDEADISSLPHPEWLGSADWDMYVGYLHIKGSYVALHENLLDLSHLTFLHSTTFGTPEYALAPIETEINEADIQVWRRVKCELPAIYAKPLGWQGQKALRSSGSQFVAPGLHINTGLLKNLEQPELQSEQQREQQQPPLPTIKVAQLITPESNHSTHYWYAGCRNFARHQPEMTEFMAKANGAAFAEDQFAIEQISILQSTDTDPDYSEINIASDKAGVQMRRQLKRLSDKENT